MKFSTSSSELLKHLQVAGGSISNNPVIPILEDFLFTIKDNELKITASDLETTLLTHVEVIADSDGTIAVPAKILLETLKGLPNQPIDFVVDEESNSVELLSAYGKYKLSGENGIDYPEIPSAQDATEIEIKGEYLVAAINNTIFATSNDELRPTMTGVYFQIEGGSITFVSTDAHKLVKFSVGIDNPDASASFIVPKKALNLLKSAVQNASFVSIKFNKSNAFFKFGDYELACRLIDGRYPDYNAVIPANNPNLLTINRISLLNSLRRIAIYANKTTNQVLLGITQDTVHISSQDLDFSNEAEETLVCQFDGQDMQIAFNAKFLIEMLVVLNDDEILLELSAPNRAGILKPAQQEDGQNLLMLVMPVMINTNPS